jgi:lipopolysaccharide transport system ATP-binding protein
LISIENLSKRYWITRRNGEGLRHALENAIKSPFRFFARGNRNGVSSGIEDFWALKEISAQIKQGEVIGVIGRNGAGKSTLLKILSRITEPTSGVVRLQGRVASLLEVGTGFHPELTGRENIFLNGSILGMTRAEIRKKFDEIVAFAEIERFLLVDEVLAVGDAGFQKKCIGKMSEVSRSAGRTVLFVSHSMPAITQLCKRALRLEAGRLVQEGTVDEVVAEYLRTCSSDSVNLAPEESLEGLRARKRLFFRSAQLLDQSKAFVNEVDVRQPFFLRVAYEVPRPLSRIELSVRLLTADGRPVMTSLQSATEPSVLDQKKQGAYEAEIEFPGMFLMPGTYLINVAAHHPAGEIFDIKENVIRFTVQDTGTHFSQYQNYQEIGVVLKELSWRERQT